MSRMGPFSLMAETGGQPSEGFGRGRAWGSRPQTESLHAPVVLALKKVFYLFKPTFGRKVENKELAQRPTSKTSPIEALADRTGYKRYECSSRILVTGDAVWGYTQRSDGELLPGLPSGINGEDQSLDSYLQAQMLCDAQMRLRELAT